MKYEPANNRLPRELHLTIHLDIHSRFVKKKQLWVYYERTKVAITKNQCDNRNTLNNQLLKKTFERFSKLLYCDPYLDEQESLLQSRNHLKHFLY